MPNQEQIKSRSSAEPERTLVSESMEVHSANTLFQGDKLSNTSSLPSATFRVSADTVQKKESGNLPGDLQQKMQSSFNEDFSNVTVHQNSQKSVQLNALAFAQGNDIHFAPGQYNPQSLKGQELIGHELAHVQQQRQGRVAPTIQSKGLDVNTEPELEQEADHLGQVAASATDVTEYVAEKNNSDFAGSNPVQLSRSYPYVAIAGAAGQSVGDISLETDSECITIPEGAQLEVLAASGSKLRVRYMDAGGVEYIGEVDATMVDDPTARQFDTDLVGRNSTWVPSGPGSRNTFERWASAPTEGAAPPIESITTINCWEMVLMAAFRARMITWQWIHDLYIQDAGDISAWYDALPARLTAGGTRPYIPGTPPARGDLVFFDGASHVSMATGNGDEIYTFWPPPNTQFTSGGTLDAVKVSTIHALSDYMDVEMGSIPTVTIGTPAW